MKTYKLDSKKRLICVMYDHGERYVSAFRLYDLNSQFGTTFDNAVDNVQDNYRRDQLIDVPGLDEESLSLTIQDYFARRNRLMTTLISVESRLASKLPTLRSDPTSHARYSRYIQALGKVKYMLQQPSECGLEPWMMEAVLEGEADPRKVSYAPESNIVFSKKRRRVSSWSKFLTWLNQHSLMTPPYLTAKEIDDFAYIVGTEFPTNYDWTFEVEGGTAVRDMYRSNSDGPHSCMSGKDYARFFEDNPDKVAIVRIIQGGKLRGRALLWNTDEGTTLLDRIYPSDGGAHIEAAIEWAQAQGYDWKPRQTYRAETARGNTYHVTVRMSLWTLSNNFPYLDTFAYADVDPARLLREAKDSELGYVKLVLHNDNEARGDTLFNKPDGTFTKLLKCALTGTRPEGVRMVTRYPEMDMVRHDVATQHGYKSISYSKGDERFVGVAHKRDVDTDFYRQSYYLKQHLTDDYAGNTINTVDAQRLPDGTYFSPHDSTLVEIPGANRFVPKSKMTQADKDIIAEEKRKEKERHAKYYKWVDSMVDEMCKLVGFQYRTQMQIAVDANSNKRQDARDLENLRQPLLNYAERQARSLDRSIRDDYLHRPDALDNSYIAEYLESHPGAKLLAIALGPKDQARVKTEFRVPFAEQTPLFLNVTRGGKKESMRLVVNFGQVGICDTNEHSQVAAPVEELAL